MLLAHAHAAQALAMPHTRNRANTGARENARALHDFPSTRCEAQAMMLAASYGCAGTALARKPERITAIFEMGIANVKIHQGCAASRSLWWNDGLAHIAILALRLPNTCA
jgi:hypothetical protein